jgi:hypothetical protein
MILAIKLGGSLIAILLLAWLAKILKLGGDARLHDEDHARRVAGESLSGFHPAEIGLDRAGFAALAKDAGNRHMLIRSHGNKFVSRMLKPATSARLDQNFLMIDVGEVDFAPVTLNLGPAAQFWASGLRHIPCD